MKGSYEIQIFSEITGDMLKSFSSEVKKASSRPIMLKINSPGGQVFEGLAMAALLQGHKPGVIVEILGLAASMATVLACMGKPVRMASNALYMIHNPWLTTAGNAHQLRQTAAELDQISVPLVNAYRARTGLPEAEVRRLMDAETWLSAPEAKKLGFVDEIGAPSAVAHASLCAAAHKWPKLAAALAKSRGIITPRADQIYMPSRDEKIVLPPAPDPNSPEALAKEYKEMRPGTARQAFYEKHKEALWAARKLTNQKSK